MHGVGNSLGCGTGRGHLKRVTGMRWSTGRDGELALGGALVGGGTLAQERSKGTHNKRQKRGCGTGRRKGTCKRHSIERKRGPWRGVGPCKGRACTWQRVRAPTRGRGWPLARKKTCFQITYLGTLMGSARTGGRGTNIVRGVKNPNHHHQ
jgi:hypothetical protein